MSKSETTHQREWRVDVKGYPCTVIGEYARDHLKAVNRELGKLRLALHKIASCQSHYPGDVVDIARKAIQRD